MHDFSVHYFSPIGWIIIKGDDEGLISLGFADEIPDEKSIISIFADQCIRQLDEYFKGQRKTFDMKIQAKGTEFQQKVWEEVKKIPYGKTTSYLSIAKTIGDKMSVRAVGHASAKNPMAIIIPCHRILGNDGDLVGYGGGLWRKKWLLGFESSQLHFIMT